MDFRMFILLLRIYYLNLHSVVGDNKSESMSMIILKILSYHHSPYIHYRFTE